MSDVEIMKEKVNQRKKESLTNSPRIISTTLPKYSPPLYLLPFLHHELKLKSSWLLILCHINFFAYTLLLWVDVAFIAHAWICGISTFSMMVIDCRDIYENESMMLRVFEFFPWMTIQVIAWGQASLSMGWFDVHVLCHDFIFISAPYSIILCILGWEYSEFM